MVDTVCYKCYYIAKLGQVEGKAYYERRFEPDKAGTIVSDGRYTEVKK